MKTDHRAIILWLSLPLAVMVSIVSLIGLLIPEIYAKETVNWLTQAVTQDAVDLFLVVPFLLVTTLYSYQRNSAAFLLWGGVLSYLVYTFIIYCFGVHFNVLFIPYCLILGLSLYAFLYFLYAQLKLPTIQGFVNELPVTITWIYFILISFLFYFLWLSEIIPATIRGTVPNSLEDSGLFTNPVHVLDLSTYLPAILLTGLMLRKRKKMAIQFAPALLTFFVIMDITIAVLMAVMYVQGIQENLVVIIFISALALFSCMLLTWYLRSSRDV